MLTNLEVYSPSSSPPNLPLELGSADTDLIHIRNIDGLGPVKASVNTRQQGTSDGEYYSGSTVGKRNLVLTLGLNPDWMIHTPSTLRQMLYGYFMPKASVALRLFSDDLPAVEISGYVESAEPNIFSKDQEMVVSIICPVPDFVAVGVSEITGIASSDPAWFEFSYRGNSAAPVLLEVKNTTAPAGPAYSGSVKIESQQILPITKTFEVIADIDVSSFLRINSASGQKKVQTIVGPETVNLLNVLVAGSIWPTVQPGVNKMRVRTTSSTGKPWTAKYYERFGGL